MILAACGDPCNPPPGPATPRTYAITATVGAVRIGPFVAWKPPARGTYAQASNVFGRATSCRVLPGKKSRVTWASIGLSIQFIGGQGLCQNSTAAQLQVLTATGARWKTSKGLAVGAPLAKLEQLYPAATGHAGTYQLARLHRGTNLAVLTATVGAGRVTGLTLAVRNGR